MSVLTPVHRKKLPAVAIGYHPARYSVRGNDFNGGYQQMQHLRTLGHENIAIVHPPVNLNFSIGYRMEGLRTAARDSDLDPDKLAFYEADFSSDGGLKCAKQLLREQPTTTAILCLTDRLAMGVIQGARELGYTIPEALTVIGYDNIPTAAVFAPPLTTVDQQAPELGRAAALMLFEILDGKTPHPIELETRLIVRSSSAKIR
jgi:LacI family transcriptional regulator